MANRYRMSAVGSPHKEANKVCGAAPSSGLPGGALLACPLCRFVAAVACQGGRGVDPSDCGLFGFIAPQELRKSHSNCLVLHSLGSQDCPPCSGMHGWSNESAQVCHHAEGWHVSEGGRSVRRLCSVYPSCACVSVCVRWPTSSRAYLHWMGPSQRTCHGRGPHSHLVCHTTMWPVLTTPPRAGVMHPPPPLPPPPQRVACGVLQTTLETSGCMS